VRVTASGYALRANAHQHEKPTTVRFSLVHCTYRRHRHGSLTVAACRTASDASC